MRQGAIAGLILLLASPQLAANGQDYGWFGSFTLGAILASGNTDTRNFNGGIKQRFVDKQWRHEMEASLLRHDNLEKVTAERYLLDYKFAYRYYPHVEFFVDLRGLQDRFAGFDYQLYETIGYRHTLVEKLYDEFKIEMGFGFTQQRHVGDTEERDTVLRLGYEYLHDFENGNQFSTGLLSLVGQENTHYHADAAVKARLLWNIAIKFTLTVNHNTVAPADKEKTDATTSVGLVYDF